MSILRCEMCGGTVVLEENGTVAVCEYCGTRKAISQPEKTTSVFVLNVSDSINRNFGVMQHAPCP